MSKRIIRTIDLTAEQITNSKDITVLLVSIWEGKEYLNGKPTGNINHYKYEVVLPYNAYERMIVKIAGVPLITPEEIAQKGGSVRVRFKNLVGKLYQTTNGDFAISASADGMEVVG